MTLGRTSSGAIKIKTDTAGGGLRAVECACCVSPCPELTTPYNVITEAMYNALQAGGAFYAYGGASEYTGCSFSGTENGIVPSGNCGASAGVQGGITCTNEGVDFGSFIGVNWFIWKVGSECRFTYTGGGSCFSDIYPPFCYTVGFFIGWGFDNGGGFGTNVGTATLTTSAGSMSFGIWNLDVSATASLNITIS